MKKLAAIFALTMSAPPHAAGPTIKPAMTVEFARGTWACATRQALEMLSIYAARGERDKVEEMQTSKGGPCTTVPPGFPAKVVSVDRLMIDPKITVLELVSARDASTGSVWAVSYGAQPVKK